MLCLLDTDGINRLAALGPGGISVPKGGIVVNSDDDPALVSVAGDITADQIRVVGGFDDGPGGGDILPLPEAGGPPAVDPLADLPTPDELPSPPVLRSNSPLVINADQTIQPGIYTSVTVTGNATLTLAEGVYVFRSTTGLTIEDTAAVVSSGDGVTVYLACGGYPSPCSGSGARFRVRAGGRFLATPPASGAYAGLSIFADRENSRFLRHQSSQELNLAGALYGASMPVGIEDTGDLWVDSLLVVGSLASLLSSRAWSRSTTTRAPTSSGWPGLCSSAEGRAPPGP